MVRAASCVTSLIACLSCNHPIRNGPSIDALAARLQIPPEELRGAFTASRIEAIETRRGLQPGSLARLVGRDVCGHLSEVVRAALGLAGPAGSVGFASWYAGCLLAVELIAQRVLRPADGARAAAIPADLAAAARAY